MRPSRALPIGAALVVLLAAVTVDVLQHGLVARVDWAVHLWISAHLQGGAARGLSTMVALLGQRGVVVVPLLVVAVLSARRRRSARPVVISLAVLIGIAIVVWLFKVGVGRVAPGSGRDEVHAGGRSYPSGHAVNAMVCWGLMLEFAASLGARVGQVLTVRRRRLLTAAVALAAGTGMTTLDYHWLSDTIAGWLVGVLILGALLAIGPVRERPAADLSPTAAPGPARPAPSE